MTEQYNNTPPVENTPAQPESMTPPSPEKSGGSGPLAGIIIIVLLLIFGGLYFWSDLTSEINPQDTNETLEEDYNEDIATTDDEPDQIDNDLDSFDSAAFEAQLEADLESVELDI